MTLQGDAAVVQRIAARVGDAGADRVARLEESIAFGERPPLAPLARVDQLRFDQGRGLYAAHCAQCHQPDGGGLRGIAPPLRGSEWVLGPVERLTRIVLHGLTGPIAVAGEQYDFPTMPDHGRLSDRELSAILTYIRRAWDHAADAVPPTTIARIRGAHATRTQPWTGPELTRSYRD